MSFFNRTAQALLNSLFGKASNFGALGSAPTLHVGLSSTAPNEDGTGITEPAGGGYARVATVARLESERAAARPEGGST
jgi:hypothetical protein